MYGIDAPLRELRIQSSDGTELAVYTAGRGPRPLIFCPGLGTPIIAWKYLFEDLQDHYTMTTWDPRGTYRSAAPDDLDALRVADHALDLEAVRTALGLGRFVLGGWSMGVQIALEYAHQHLDRIQALILINGAYEKVLSTAFGIPGANVLLPAILRLGNRAMPLLSPLISKVLGHDHAPNLVKHMGMVSNNVEHFGRMVRMFSDTDWEVYFRLMLALNEHSADPYLPQLDVPALVTAGTKDAMTPLHTAETLTSRLPDAELLVVPDGTHYTQIEFPDILNRGIIDFLRRVDPEAW